MILEEFRIETPNYILKIADEVWAQRDLFVRWWAIHPIAGALADEVPYFAWLLRREAFERFGFDPDCVFR